MTSKSGSNHARARSGAGGVVAGGLSSLVALANAGALPEGHTPLSVAKLLARESKESSGEAVALLSTSVVDLFAEAPAEVRGSEDVPTWIELIPAPLPEADEGHVETRDWRCGFICDPQKIVDAFNAKPKHRRAAPLDWEHKGHRNWMAERNPAAGWIEELKVGDDGESVWGRIDWTPEGRSDVANKRYRYISPVVAILWPADTEGNIDWDAVPVATELIDAALTNNPATFIRDLARTPVGDSDESENSAGAHALAASAAPGPVRTGGRIEDDKMQFSKQLLSTLGLGEDATVEQVEHAMLAKLAKPSTSAPETPATPVPATFTRDEVAKMVQAEVAAAVTPLQKELEERRGKDQATAAELLRTQIDAIVEPAIASFKATPAMREGLVQLGMKAGVEVLRAHVDALPSHVHLTQSAGKGETGKEPNKIELNADEKLLCQQLGLTAEQFVAQREREALNNGKAA